MLKNVLVAALTITATVPAAMANAQAPAGAPPVAPVVAAPPTPPAMRQLVLAPNTEVVVTPNDTLNTKTVKVGDKFKVATVFDVM